MPHAVMSHAGGRVALEARARRHSRHVARVRRRVTRARTALMDAATSAHVGAHEGRTEPGERRVVVRDESERAHTARAHGGSAELQRCTWDMGRASGRRGGPPSTIDHALCTHEAEAVK